MRQIENKQQNDKFKSKHVNNTSNVNDLSTIIIKHKLLGKI